MEVYCVRLSTQMCKIKWDKRKKASSSEENHGPSEH